MIRLLATSLLCGALLFPNLTAFGAPVSSGAAADTMTFAQLQQELAHLHITSSQYYVLQLANSIGNKYGLGKSLMAIAWQESKAGRFGPVGDIKAGFGYRSYGICQIKLRTARLMLKKYPALRQYSEDDFSTDDELMAELITNKTFNLDMAAHILLYLKDKGFSWSQMIEVYNLGHLTRHPAKFKYTRAISKNMRAAPVANIASRG